MRNQPVVGYLSGAKARGRIILLVLCGLALGVSACGSGSSTPPPPSQFTMGGTVTNLAGMGGGLQLQDNGTDALLVNANGSTSLSFSCSSFD